MTRHFGPRADAHAVGLLHGKAGGKRLQQRLAVAPHALLQGAPQLGLVGLAHEVPALVVERRIQKEALVRKPEGLARLADPALAQGDELLTFGKRADGNGPFSESNWHKRGVKLQANV